MALLCKKKQWKLHFELYAMLMLSYLCAIYAYASSISSAYLMLYPCTKYTFWLWQKREEIYNCIFKGEKRLYKKGEIQKYGAHIKGEFISKA